MLKRIFAKFLPPHRQGVALDFLFILLGLFVLPFIGGRLERLFEKSFEENEKAFLVLLIIVIFVFLWRFFALAVKRIPVRDRFDDEKGFRFLLGFWILNLFVVLLSAAFLIVAIIELIKIFGLGDFGGYSNLIGAVGLIFPVAELFLLHRLTKPLSENEKRNKRKKTNPLTELFADFGLFAYLFVWQAFYNAYLAAITPNAFRSVGVFIFVLIISAAVFVMFYVGPRSVFLIEDAGYKSTWIGISLVFLASLISHLLF